MVRTCAFIQVRVRLNNRVREAKFAPERLVPARDTSCSAEFGDWTCQLPLAVLVIFVSKVRSTQFAIFCKQNVDKR